MNKTNSKLYVFLILSFLGGSIFGYLLVQLLTVNDKTDELEKELIKNSLSYNYSVTKALPSVVNIYSKKFIKSEDMNSQKDLKNEIFKPNKLITESNLGSGVIFSSDGYILTNQHVIIDRSLNVIVELINGRKAEAKIIGIDKGTDLAVLKIESEELNLPPIEIADSRRLKIGDVVLAIGNPYGIGQSVTMGIISATGREFNNPYSNYLQTDAAINFGNSGGALVDTYGRLVGINTFIKSSSGGSDGIGFAVPSSLVLEIINDLIQYGEVKRGWLGFSIDKNILLSKNILLIADISEKSPAQKGGLRAKDIILKINGNKASYELLFKEFARSRNGSKINMKVLRENKEIELVLTSKSPST